MPRLERSTPVPTEATESSTASGWLFIIGFLLVARYLQPTEAVGFGETLWLGQLWIVVAAAWCWRQYRGGGRTLRIDALDVCVWVMAIGHGLSTVKVLIDGGDRRGAVNITWEWFGLAATLFLIRQACLEENRKRVLAAFAAMAVALAGLGVWQYHVGLAQTTAEYEEMMSLDAELRAKVARGDATENERAQLEELQRQIAEAGVPTDEASRARWENRVKFSTEPFATFALANTFGGLLAAALPVLIAFLWPARRSVSWGVIAASSVAVLYCLFLTKSRTAWVGLFAGSAVTLVLQLAGGRLQKRVVTALGVGLVGVMLVAVLVLATGGIDREVFSEAPKSLQYRLDYWAGTMGVLAESPLLGTGPGNFRSYYLEHRVMGASEEIAAPHNLFFDIWVSGGVIALAGLVGFLVFVALRLLKQSASITEADHRGTWEWGSFEWGAVAAFPVVTGLLILAGAGIDTRLLLLCPLFAVVLVCLLKLPNDRALMSVGAGAGFVALSVHLLGADGMELPAVVQTLFVLAVCLERSGRTLTASVRAPITGMIVFGMLGVGCLLTGLAPVLNSNALMSRAESLIASGDPAALRVLGEAAEADPLALRPVVLQAELAWSRAVRTQSRADKDAARDRWREVLEADPRNLQARSRIADLLLMPEQEDQRAVNEAIALLAESIDLSPTDVEVHAHLANALSTVGREDAAAEAAQRALDLDNVNRAAGHTDIVLGQRRREELMSLAKIGKPGAEP